MISDVKNFVRETSKRTYTAVNRNWGFHNLLKWEVSGVAHSDSISLPRKKPYKPGTFEITVSLYIRKTILTKKRQSESENQREKEFPWECLPLKQHRCSK